MINKLLEVNNLKTYFNASEGIVRAVDGINFSIEKGQILGIVGESGSGKSVSCLSLLRLLDQRKINHIEGSVNLHDDDHLVDLMILEEKSLEKVRGAKVSMIFQEPMSSLNPSLSCGSQIREVIEIHSPGQKSTIKERVFNLLKDVGFEDVSRIYQAYPHQVSGGQLQRIVIAIAIACNPKLILADEPTTALDVTVQKNILGLIDRIRREKNSSVIFVSHDLGVVASVADRIAVMFEGKIVEIGNVADVFKNPNHPYTKALLACRPPLDKKLKRLPTVGDFMTVEIREDGQRIVKEIKSGYDVKEQTITAKEIKAHLSSIEHNELLLDVINLNKSFPRSEGLFFSSGEEINAVQDVSFRIREGEILGLVGESGCGKSTLAKTILKLIPASSGQVVYKNQDVFALSNKEMRNLRKEVQIIFQDPYSSLNPRMSVGNAILEPMQVHGLYENDKKRKEKVTDLLEMVGMKAEHYSRLPDEFSGGQRQRICIARALALNPRLLICDECVSALDVSIQAQILNLLLQLREELKLSYLFISHDLSVVKFISDNLLVMKDGNIIESGSAEEVYSNPKHDYTRALIEAIPAASI